MPKPTNPPPPARAGTPPTREFCVVADDDCVNPPGYGNSVGYYECDDPRTRHKCPRCGEPACRKCRNRAGVCNTCQEHDYAD